MSTFGIHLTRCHCGVFNWLDWARSLMMLTSGALYYTEHNTFAHCFDEPLRCLCLPLEMALCATFHATSFPGLLTMSWGTERIAALGYA